MSIPLIDIHLRHLVNFTIQTVVGNPDKYIPEIFGDAKLQPHAAIYGDRLFQEIKQWIAQPGTRIPVVLGYDLDPTQLPGVSINLIGSIPEQPFMGDVGLTMSQDIPEYQREVIVPQFAPVLVQASADNTFITVTLPDSFEHPELFWPGTLVVRDNKQQIYGIGQDKDNPTIVSLGEGYAQLKDGDFSQLELVSPYLNTRSTQGVMYFQEQALITVHGHADRTEGLWLWAIVQWGLLKFRPLMTSLFGLDLGLPSASDFVKADEFQGENVWRRFITLSTKVVWSWEGPQQTDALAFILSIQNSPASS